MSSKGKVVEVHHVRASKPAEAPARVETVSKSVELGKIDRVRLGFGGYQGAEFGFTISLGGKGWSTSDFIGYWADRPSGAQWSKEEQQQAWGLVMAKVRDWMREAKVNDYADLAGKPVEAIYVGNSLQSWRILTEVL